MWDAFADGGIDAVVELVDEDVEWHLFGAPGRVLHGRDELRQYMEERLERGERVEAETYSFEERGECILASGHVRWRTAEGMTDTQLHWLYVFEDERLARFESFTSRERALAAVSARC